MMKTITRLGSIAAAFTLALSAVAHAAPKAERANRYFTIAGNILQINNSEHTLLVEDRSSSKLYLIQMFEGAALKITFGKQMKMREPGFVDVNIRERVEIRCLREDREHLALLSANRAVVQVTATP